MRIGNGEIRLDVEEGSAVEHVGTADVDDGSVRRVGLNAFNRPARQSDGIGAEWRTSGKDSQSDVAPQARRPHRRRPSLTVRFREVPDEPEMREAFQSAECIGIAVGRGKDDASPQRADESALTWNAEFRGKVCAEMGDDFQRLVMRVVLGRFYE